MSGENVIQTACMDALAVYFYGKGLEYRQLFTYANQQGDEANRFCGDLIGVIENANMFALEMKALNHETGELSEFKPHQFAEAKEMEQNGIPIFYCYDYYSPLAYNVTPRKLDWPTLTLNQFKLSRPKDLDCEKPKQTSHEVLLTWLERQSKITGGSALAKFAEVVGQVLPNKMRNGLLTFLYSNKNRQAFALNQESMHTFYTYLLNNPGKPGSEVDRRIKSLLDGIQIGQTRAQSKNGNGPKKNRPKI